MNNNNEVFNNTSFNNSNNQVYNNSSINNNIPVETLTSIPNKNNKKKIKIILIIFAVLIVLIIGGLIAYKEIVLLNKKDVIKNSISTIFNSVNNTINDINKNILPIDANEESIGIDGTIKATSSYKDDEVDLTKLNNYILKYNSAIDLKNNKLSGSINLNKDDNNLLSINTFINGKYGLVESNQLSYYAYEYNIGKEIKDINLNNKDNINTLNKIIDRTRDLVLSRINENDITRDTVEETINGKKANYTRFTYRININNMTNEILKFYIQDTSVTNTLANLFSTDVNTLKKNIQSIIDNNKGNEIINYEVYLDNFIPSFKQIKIYNVNNSNNYFKVYKVENNYEYEYIVNDNTMKGNISNNKLTSEIGDISFEFEKVNNNEFKVVSKYQFDNNFLIFDLNIKSNIENDKQKVNIVLSTNSGNKDRSGTLDININIDLDIYKNATVRPITSFINKDISAIDLNESQDIDEKFNNIINNIINDIYIRKLNDNINNNNRLLDFNLNI